MKLYLSVHFFSLLKRLWSCIEKKRQRGFVLLFFLMVVSSFLEVVSIGAVLPFLTVLTEPDRIFNNAIIRSFFVKGFGLVSSNQLLFPLTATFIILVIISAAIRWLLLQCSTKLSFDAGLDLSISMYRRALYQPYRAHLARNSSEVISGIANKTSTVVVGILLPLLMFLSSAFILFFMVIALIAASPKIAFLSSVFFCVSYGLIAVFTKNKLKLNGLRIASGQTQLFKILQEGLGGIRDVLLDSLQSFYCDLYQKADKELRIAQSSNTIISASPRLIMEPLGMIFLAVIAYNMSLKSGGLSGALPILGALALGAQRLMPALQQIYSSWSLVVGNAASLKDVFQLLELPQGQILDALPRLLSFKHSIQFDSVRFRYNKRDPWVLDKIDLCVEKGARIGLLGTTGGGKSTLLDVLMGLLEPTEGHILVDGISISGCVESWQKNIAHVPQSIYLIDATLAENIAFGISLSDIDLDRMRDAARRAQLSDFIESHPDGYNVLVGERGVRLSGGQRQRIGIARALYKKANVLIFDEATSALDGATEQAVISAIERLDKNITIFFIAHRLTAFQCCDQIFELKNGALHAIGSYNEMLSIERL